MEGNEVVSIENIVRQQTPGAQFSNRDISMLPVQGGPGCLQICRTSWDKWAASTWLQGLELVLAVWTLFLVECH